MNADETCNTINKEIIVVKLPRDVKHQVEHDGVTGGKVYLHGLLRELWVHIFLYMFP